jgi:hypothetical protein
MELIGALIWSLQCVGKKILTYYQHPQNDLKVSVFGKWAHGWQQKTTAYLIYKSSKITWYSEPNYYFFLLRGSLLRVSFPGPLPCDRSYMGNSLHKEARSRQGCQWLLNCSSFTKRLTDRNIIFRLVFFVTVVLTAFILAQLIQVWTKKKRIVILLKPSSHFHVKTVVYNVNN